MADTRDDHRREAAILEHAREHNEPLCSNPNCIRPAYEDDLCLDCYETAMQGAEEDREADRLCDLAREHGLDEWQAARGI